MGRGEEGKMFHDFCSIPPGRDPAKIMKRPSGKKWVSRRFAQMELSYFSLFPQRTVAEFVIPPWRDEKCRNGFSRNRKKSIQSFDASRLLIIPDFGEGCCGIFGSGTPERKCRNIFFFACYRISENQ